MRWLLAPLVLVAGVACHKAASPLSPAAPEERSGPLTFVSGETQQPVAGAHVVVAGQVYSTDDSGRDHVGSGDRKSTRLNSSHGYISYAVFCLKKKKKTTAATPTSVATVRGARPPATW